MIVFQQAEEAVQCLKPVGVALDAMQVDSVSIADGVEIWKNPLNKFRNSEQREWLLLAETRYNNAVSDVWFAANVLHPKYGGQQLTQSELKLAMEFIKDIHEEALEDFVLFIGGENVKFYDEFKKIGDVKINFVKAQVLLGNLSEKLGNISEQLMAMVPSSAGLERIFSSMGYIHSEIRNRLDPEKVRKLAFCMRLLSSAANLE